MVLKIYGMGKPVKKRILNFTKKDMSWENS